MNTVGKIYSLEVLTQEAHEQPHADLKFGATVGKFRRKANGAGSVMDLDRAERHAYADAIEKTIRAKHRTLHQRSTPPLTPGWYTPPSITRLLKYDKPIKMQGDPDWLPKCNCHSRSDGCKCDHWASRQKAVYAAMMEAKA